MDITQLIEAALKMQIEVIMLLLWWFERRERIDAQRRERQTLRQVAELPPDEE